MAIKMAKNFFIEFLLKLSCKIKVFYNETKRTNLCKDNICEDDHIQNIIFPISIQITKGIGFTST